MLGWWRRWRDRRGGGAARGAEAADASEASPGERDASCEGGGEQDAPALTDELDLHTFQPRECADVVEEYLRAAHEAGLRTVRIVHGKGTGTLRRIVHGVLERHPAVQSFRLAGATRGGWGATVVELRSIDAPGGGSSGEQV